MPVFSLWARELMGDTSRITVLEARISEIESRLIRCLWSPLVASFVAILLIHHALTTRQTFFSYDPRIFPVRATDWVSQHPIDGNMLNELNWGGYLLHRMWPAQRVFIDSQTDFYGEHFIREYADLVSAKPGWQQQLMQYNVSWVMIRSHTPLSGELRLDPGWQKVFEDPTAVIFMRDSP